MVNRFFSKEASHSLKLPLLAAYGDSISKHKNYLKTSVQRSQWHQWYNSSLLYCVVGSMLPKHFYLDLKATKSNQACALEVLELEWWTPPFLVLNVLSLWHNNEDLDDTTWSSGHFWMVLKQHLHRLTAKAVKVSGLLFQKKICLLWNKAGRKKYIFQFNTLTASNWHTKTSLVKYGSKVAKYAELQIVCIAFTLN